MSSNMWGPFYPQSQFEYPADGGQPTAPATPPQSPSGSVTGDSAEYNYVNEITSTENFLQNVMYVDVVEPATDALTSPVQIQGLASVAISQNAWCGGAIAPVIS
jgi:hypothetical protein